MTAMYTNVNEIVNYWDAKFMENKVDNPKESIELILSHILKINNVSKIYQKDGEVQDTDIRQIEELCLQRLKNIPVPYLTQRLDFRGLTLKMSPPVFIPQIQTAMIVDIVVKEIDAKNIDRTIELCCGSGAISLAILQERPHMKVLSLDHLPECCQLTRENAKLNNLSDRVEVQNVTIGSENCKPEDYEKLDLIVSNPPYVPANDYKDLPEEYLKYQDLTAQDGGNDGLKIMRPVLKFSSVVLNAGGKLILEVHPSLPKLIRNYLEQNENLKLQYVRTFPGLYGEDRFLEILKTE